MTTYQFGNITLEHDREWRAWVTLSHGTLQRGDAVYVRGTWYGTNESAVGEPMLLGSLYRRPVPLPLLDPDLTDTLWVHGWSATEDSVERVYVHPTTGEETHSHDTARDWLRALLPGYEEQLNSSAIPNSSQAPVPADGWRPIETLTQQLDAAQSRIASLLKHWPGEWVYEDALPEMTKEQFDRAYEFSKVDGVRMYPAIPGITVEPLEQPLPPPPQEKGGEA